MIVFRFNYVLFLLVLIIIFSCRRDTKLFGKLKINGRLIDYITKQPVANAAVYLDYATVVQTKYKYRNLATTTTDGNGNFTFESKLARTNDYNVTYSTNDYKRLVDTVFSLPSSHKLNLGDLNYGEYTFTIKLHLIPTSGNCIFVNKSSFKTHAQFIKINAGVDTTLTISYPVTYVEYKQYPYFPLQSAVASCSTTLSSIQTFVRNSYAYNVNGGTTMIDLNY